MERRLTAILAADVVGYSRLMGVTRPAHSAALTALRDGSHRPQNRAASGTHRETDRRRYAGGISKRGQRGRLRCEFSAGCAIAMTGCHRTAASNFVLASISATSLSKAKTSSAMASMWRRGWRSIAPVGGIAVSQSVRDHVGKRLDLIFEDMGERRLKNIERPIRVYSVSLDAPTEQTSGAASAHPQEKPSIAVLPFINMSGDPEQEYFSDGITEDIITDLSKVSGLFVVARNTAFTYKGKSCRSAGSREAAWRQLYPGRKRPKGRVAGPSDWTADRWQRRAATCGPIVTIET